MLLEVILSSIVSLLISLWLYLRIKWSYWEKRNIATVPYEFPFGGVKQSILLKKTLAENLADLYNQHEDQKMIGFYGPIHPALIIKDPELIKTILIKEFNNFHANGYTMSSKSVDPLMQHNPFVIKDFKRWKQVRGIHTAVNSIAKLKNMVPEIAEIAKNFANYIAEQNGKPIEVKSTTRFFTIDSIAKFAFGVESDSFHDTNSTFKVYTLGELFCPGSQANYAILSAYFSPLIGQLFGWRTITVKAELFFMEMIKSCIKHRENSGETRMDLVHVLWNINKKAKQENTTGLSDIELASNSMTAFIDSVETTANSLTFTLFEIAANENIQNKLREEIRNAINKPADLDFDKLGSLSYLDMITSESLRKYPPIPFLTRTCTEETHLNGIKIKPGLNVFIPVLAIHRDPKLYPEPEKFIPERFSTENVNERNKYNYLPFGEGPRICFGYKYGVTVIKIAIVSLLMKYQLRLENPKQTTLKFDNASVFMITPKGEININFTPL